MYQLFSWKTWVALGAWGALLAATAVNFLESYSGNISIPMRMVVLTVLALPSLLFWDKIWRFLWRKIPALNKLVFPDLNGDWDMTISSNWPIQDKLLKASKSKKIIFNSLDLKHSEQTSDFSLKARISQSWLRFHIRVWSENDGVVQESNTLVVAPKKLETDDHGFHLYYIFDQSNSKVVSTDENRYFGAAVLTLKGEPWNNIEGLVWTNRNWQSGINTAGRVKLTKPEL